MAVRAEALPMSWNFPMGTKLEVTVCRSRPRPIPHICVRVVGNWLGQFDVHGPLAVVGNWLGQFGIHRPWDVPMECIGYYSWGRCCGEGDVAGMAMVVRQVVELRRCGLPFDGDLQQDRLPLSVNFWVGICRTSIGGLLPAMVQAIYN